MVSLDPVSLQIHPLPSSLANSVPNYVYSWVAYHVHIIKEKSANPFLETSRKMSLLSLMHTESHVDTETENIGI